MEAALRLLAELVPADTNDTREAPAIRICRDLLEEGAQLVIHDPKVEADQIARDLHQEASAVPDPNAGSSRAGSWARAPGGKQLTWPPPWREPTRC